jgi:hypothetical protein
MKITRNGPDTVAMLDGSSASWGAHVTDEEYRAAPAL